MNALQFYLKCLFAVCCTVYSWAQLYLLSKEAQKSESVSAGIQDGAATYFFSVAVGQLHYTLGEVWESRLYKLDTSLAIIDSLSIYPLWSKDFFIDRLFSLSGERIGIAGVVTLTSGTSCNFVGWVDKQLQNYHIDTFLCGQARMLLDARMTPANYLNLLVGSPTTGAIWVRFLYDDTHFVFKDSLYLTSFYASIPKFLPITDSVYLFPGAYAYSKDSILLIYSNYTQSIDSIKVVGLSNYNDYTIFIPPQIYFLYNDTLFWEGTSIVPASLSVIGLQKMALNPTPVLVDTIILGFWQPGETASKKGTFLNSDFYYPWWYSTVIDDANDFQWYVIGPLPYNHPALHYFKNTFTVYRIDVRSMEVLWQASLGYDMLYVPQGIIITPDSGCIVYGWRMNTDPLNLDFGFGDAFLWRIDKNGKVVKTLGSVPPPMLVVYPNPVEDYFYVRAHKVPLERIVCYDVQGRLIKEWRRSDWEKIDKDLWRVGVSGLSSGVYLLQFLDKEGSLLMHYRLVVR